MRQFYVTPDPKQFSKGTLGKENQQSQYLTENQKYEVLAIQQQDQMYNVVVPDNSGTLQVIPFSRVKFAGYVNEGIDLAQIAEIAQGLSPLIERFILLSKEQPSEAVSPAPEKLGKSPAKGKQG